MKRKKREWEPTSKRKKMEGETTAKRKPAPQFFDYDEDRYVEWEEPVVRQQRPSKVGGRETDMKSDMKDMIDEFLDDHDVEDAVEILADLIKWVVTEYEND